MYLLKETAHPTSVVQADPVSGYPSDHTRKESCTQTSVLPPLVQAETDAAETS